MWISVNASILPLAGEFLALPLAEDAHDGVPGVGDVVLLCDAVNKSFKAWGRIAGYTAGGECVACVKEEFSADFDRCQLWSLMKPSREAPPAAPARNRIPDPHRFPDGLSFFCKDSILSPFLA